MCVFVCNVHTSHFSRSKVQAFLKTCLVANHRSATCQFCNLSIHLQARRIPFRRIFGVFFLLLFSHVCLQCFACIESSVGSFWRWTTLIWFWAPRKYASLNLFRIFFFHLVFDRINCLNLWIHSWIHTAFSLPIEPIIIYRTNGYVVMCLTGSLKIRNWKFSTENWIVLMATKSMVLWSVKKLHMWMHLAGEPMLCNSSLLSSMRGKFNGINQQQKKKNRVKKHTHVKIGR